MLAPAAFVAKEMQSQYINTAQDRQRLTLVPCSVMHLPNPRHKTGNAPSKRHTSDVSNSFLVLFSLGDKVDGDVFQLP